MGSTNNCSACGRNPRHQQNDLCRECAIVKMGACAVCRWAPKCSNKHAYCVGCAKARGFA